jgi:hypothetical protein
MIPPLENLFVLDIETVSTSPDWEQLDETWKELWAKKIDKQLPEGETPEGFYPMRAAILAEFGKVISAPVGVPPFLRRNRPRSRRCGVL